MRLEISGVVFALLAGALRCKQHEVSHGAAAAECCFVPVVVIGGAAELCPHCALLLLTDLNAG